MTNLLKLLSKYYLILLFISPSLCAQQEFEVGIVNQSVINLRTFPRFSAEMGTQALMGTPVHILKTVHGWSSVMTPDGYTAWTSEESVQKMSQPEYAAWKAAPKVIVSNYFTVLKSKPAESAEVISDVVWGDILCYQGQKGKYIQVLLPDGRMGFLLKPFAKPFNEWFDLHLPTAANIIETATHFIGFPYLWGGTSIKGMDCSGFTKTCYYLNGVILPRDASQQALTGENVDISKGFNQLKPADLLFFGSKKENKEHVTHVGMYIGNGMFIQSAGTIHISSLLPGNNLYDDYNTKRLLRAQRLLTRIDIDSSIVSIKKHPFYRD
jgi:SH3-like domain-containing protein